jgi:hypothetical protein
MSRGIAPAVTNSVISERHIRLVTFAKIQLDSGTLYLHDSVGTFTWADPVTGAQDWLGLGDFGGIGAVEESLTMSGYELNLVLSGLDATMLDEVINQNYQGRGVTIYLGALDLSNGSLLATPNEIWAGAMDVGRVSLGSGDDNAIQITCESDFARLEDINGRTFTDADLQAEYTGDTFLQYLPAMEDARIVWRGDTFTRFNPTTREPQDPRTTPKQSYP